MSTTPAVTFDPCPICDGESWVFVRDLDSADRFKLFRCVGCGHVMQNPIPSDEQLVEAYSGAYSPYKPAWRETGWPIWKILRCWTTSRRISLLKRYGAGNNLLEVGAGAGDFLAAAHKCGWQVKAVEYKSEMCAAIRSEFEFDIRSGHLERDTWPAQSFDVVALWNVLEHLQNPGHDLELVSNYLRSGGRVLLNIPTRYAAERGKRFGTDWALLCPPQHINFFDQSSLSRLCEKSGLRVVYYRTPFLQSAWCYYMSAVNRAKGNKLLFLFLSALVTTALPYIFFEAGRNRGTEASAVLEKIPR